MVYKRRKENKRRGVQKETEQSKHRRDYKESGNNKSQFQSSIGRVNTMS